MEYYDEYDYLSNVALFVRLPWQCLFADSSTLATLRL